VSAAPHGSASYTPLDTPESIPTVFVEAWNNRDADTLASVFDADAEFVNVVGLWWHDASRSGRPTRTASSAFSTARRSDSARCA
jgi:hypothetical protein